VGLVRVGGAAVTLDDRTSARITAGMAGPNGMGRIDSPPTQVARSTFVVTASPPDAGAPMADATVD
jgi:hypothetical protein